MGDRGSMKEVFVQCQTGLQGHGKLMKTLQKIYDKTEFEAFWSEFHHYLNYAMIIFKREPAVERVIDFVSKFAPTLCKKSLDKGVDREDGDTSQDGEEDSVADNRLLQEMFDFLLTSHSARERGVRFRCCQLINKLLTNLGEDAQIDDELYDRLYECMLERLKDKCPMVRYHAVLAMARLQDPTDENCPVIKAYLFLLNCDPNADVRRAVLSSVAPSTKTLSSIIGRTRDVKDTVRKTAYEVLAEKIHIKALSIALRLQLINEGLKDRSDSVQQACSGKLLQAWLRTFGGNILDLLKSLDVEDSTDVCSRVLETLFKATTVQDMIISFSILDEHLLVPIDALSSESALYWQAVCKFIHAMGTDGDEHMEKVMPTVVEFCAYMQRYIVDLKTVEDPEIQLGREFIIQQLLLITSYMDTADAASKKALETLLHNMLMADQVSHRLVKSVVERICALRGTGDGMVPYFAEMVSEIREPITVVQKDIEEEQKRQINLKIAGVRVQLNQLREDLDTAVKDQDFEKAAEIKGNIAHLDAEKNQLLETSEPVREEFRTEKNDPLTLLKCQTIISEMLQQLKLNSVSPTLQMMIESQIVPGIQNEDAEVRNMAMQALGLCCYLSKDLLVTYIPLFMQASQIDVEGVRVTALQVLFDLLLIYGLEIVDASEGSSTDSSDLTSTDAISTETDSTSRESRAGTASKLVAIICSFLDGDSSDLRTCAAEGLSKLLLSGRVVSSKILSHLILLWYNPLSEDDTHLRDCLGTFFPLYALASRSNQELVEEAFLPTLRTLLNAPATSPLAEVDVNNVAELLVQLTNTRLLTANQNNPEQSMDNPGHDNLSETVCNEILSNPGSIHVKLWVRILNQMEVSPDNEVVLKDLRILAYKMVKTVKEKTCLKALQKFQGRINELAGKFVTDNNDLENIEIETVQYNAETVEEVLDETDQTPKRKRVRGLYSQNMTLAMESESELDIADDSTVEVDASCLMSRTSVETPSRRGRKNTTTTELTEEDVFVVPGEPEPLVNESRSKSMDHDANTQAEVLGDKPEVSAGNQSVPKTPENKKAGSVSRDKSLGAKSPDKRGRPVEKKTASPKKSGQKSPRKSQDKRKASRSPADVSPEKRIASESPARGSQEKRKASKSPSREKKRMSKSPARSASEKRSSKSPAGRQSVKSPLREQRSKSHTRTPESSKKTSPVRSGTEKRKSSESPAKSLSKGENMSPAPAKKVKENEKVSKVTGKSTVNNVKDAVKTAVKGKPGKEKEEKKGQTPERKKSVSKVVDTNNKQAEKNTRKVLQKSGESPALVKSKSVVAVKTNSHKPAKGVKSSGSGTFKGVESPQKARKASSKTVADTPEQMTRRGTRSLLGTPDVTSPGGRRGNKTAVAETPEHAVTGKKPEQKKVALTSARATTRQAGPNPVVKVTDVRGTRQKATGAISRAAVKNDRKAASSSASSTSDSSPEKSTKSSRTARGKLSSSTDSSTSSPASVKGQKPKTGKASPVKNQTLEVSVTTTDDEEEVALKRKAKPSRRSATASVATAATPSVAGRSTRASLSQNAVGSPTVASPRQPRPGVASSVVTRRGQTPTSKQATPNTAARPGTRSGGDSSSQGTSTLSLVSSQRSASSSQKFTSSQRSTVSSVSGKSQDSQSSRPSSRSAVTVNKPASTRSTSADSTKSKPTASKVTRSAVATRVTRELKPVPGKLKRPLRSTLSDKK